MRYLFFLQLLVLPFSMSFAQTQPQPEFKEGKAVVFEGVEFLYSLGAEESKLVDGVEYSYFNVDCSVTNGGRFSKIFLRGENAVPDPQFNLYREAYIAIFHVTNGLQLPSTSKSAILKEDFNMELFLYSKMFPPLFHKKGTRKGFNFQAGQTLSKSIRVAVPKGQRPTLSVQMFLSPLY